MFKVPEKFRITTGRMASSVSNGNNGLFEIPLPMGQLVFVIASDGLGWEHVSVSRRDRSPTWDEMCQIKDLFWGEDDCVVQYHPPKREHVNNHQFCLHLWRPIGVEMPAPEAMLVGLKGVRLV